MGDFHSLSKKSECPTFSLFNLIFRGHVPRKITLNRLFFAKNGRNPTHRSVLINCRKNAAAFFDSLEEWAMPTFFMLFFVLLFLLTKTFAFAQGFVVHIQNSLGREVKVSQLFISFERR